MNVLVTGATGFTGGHLALELKRRGHSVRALARPGAAVETLAARGVEVVRGDITRPRDVRAATKGMDRIYHIAALYREAKHADRRYWDVNVGGTESVLEAARRHGVERVIHCSTGGVHGHIRRIPADEDAPFNPGDVYQRTKLEGELRVQEAIRAGLPATVVRPAAIYGPGDTRLLKLFRAVRSGWFVLFGSGRVRYHLVHVSDLVDGMILCGTRERAVGRTYILAGPRDLTIRELVALIAEAVGVRPPRIRLPLWPLLAAAAACEAACRPIGVEPPLHRRRADFFRKDRGFTSRRAETEIGYRARIGPERGIPETAEWYVARGYLERGPRLAGAASEAHA